MFVTLQKKILFLTLLGCSSIIQASAYDWDNNPTSYVGTTGKAKYSKSITDNSAFSVLGEAGPRNYRLGATVGLLIHDDQRLKISGDFLRQDIEYAFYSGNSREWVQQGSVGAYYRYDLNEYSFLPQVNLKAGYSHAPSKNLYTVYGSNLNALGQVQTFTNDRRIAGSNALYASPGISIQPWQTGRIGVELNYDDVQYDRIYCHSEKAQGVGGSANITQKLGENTELGVNVGIREPFNAYQANIAYTLPSKPDWTLGLDANYVEGKHFLPNTYNVGISVSYVMSEGRLNVNNLEKEPTLRPSNGLSSWTASPAIYLPQVLAITDERVVAQVVPVPVIVPPVCNAPTLIGTIPAQSTTVPLDVATAAVFSGTTPFTYTVSFTPVTAGTTVTIDPSTGVVTITPGIATFSYEFDVTVTATNSCGNVSTTFAVNVPFQPQTPTLR